MSGRRLAPGERCRLTRREDEILSALIENGASTKALMERFNCSDITIKVHIGHIFDKTGYSTRCELIANTLHKMYGERK